MADDRVREFERIYQESGGFEDGERFMRAMARAGSKLDESYVNTPLLSCQESGNLLRKAPYPLRLRLAVHPHFLHIGVNDFGLDEYLHTITQFPMVLIPSGSFMMGTPPDQEGNDDERPYHQVTIGYENLVQKYPITQIGWERITGKNPSRFKGEDGERKPMWFKNGMPADVEGAPDAVDAWAVVKFCNENKGAFLRDGKWFQPVDLEDPDTAGSPVSEIEGTAPDVDEAYKILDFIKSNPTVAVHETAIDADGDPFAIHPVENVSWLDVREFAAKSGLDFMSEAEWEYSARAGTTERFIYGNDEAALQRVAVYGRDWQAGHTAVGTKEANPFGLHDVIGLVWEWVKDEYHDTYKDAPTDGSAWTSEWEEAAKQAVGQLATNAEADRTKEAGAQAAHDAEHHS